MCNSSVTHRLQRIRIKTSQQESTVTKNLVIIIIRCCWWVLKQIKIKFDHHTKIKNRNSYFHYKQTFQTHTTERRKKEVFTRNYKKNWIQIKITSRSERVLGTVLNYRINKAFIINAIIKPSIHRFARLYQKKTDGQTVSHPFNSLCSCCDDGEQNDDDQLITWNK